MITLRISDMTCGHCASTIARAVAGVDKGARVEVDLPRKTVNITGSAPGGELMEAIQEAGYTPEELATAPVEAPRARSGCGCGCGPRAAPTVDIAQTEAAPGRSCCG